MQQIVKEERSAGGVVYRRIEPSENPEFLIGKHSGYHKWVLPKGLVERGESQAEAARREVFEEVGVKVRMVGEQSLKTIEYSYMADLAEVRQRNPHTEATTRRVMTYQEAGGKQIKVHKTVVYYLMELVSEEPTHGWEMIERRWVSYGEGMGLLAFASEREVLESARRALVV